MILRALAIPKFTELIDYLQYHITPTSTYLEHLYYTNQCDVNISRQ